MALRIAVSNTSMPGLRVDVSARVSALYTMPSAVARLPLRMTLLLNCCSVGFPYLRSGRRLRSDDRADAALLGRATAQLHEATFLRVPGRPERRCVDFLALRLASLAYELRDRGHVHSFTLDSRAHVVRRRVLGVLPWFSPRPESPPGMG